MSILPFAIRHIYEIGKIEAEAVMATQKRGSHGINTGIGGAFMLLWLAGLVAGLNYCECPFSAFFRIPMSTVFEALPSVILAAWQVFGPCLLTHIRLLDGLLQVSLSCGQLALALAGAA